MLKYRHIQPEDNKALAAMIRQVFIEHDAPQQGTVFSDPTTDDLYALFEHTQSVLWVAELDGQAIGCCGIYPTQGLPDRHVELVKFYLAKAGRGQGIGRELMQRSIASAKTMGYQSIYIESLPEFGKAINIYEKQGFELLAQPLGQSGHTSCDVWMIRHL